MFLQKNMKDMFNGAVAGLDVTLASLLKNLKNIITLMNFVKVCNSSDSNNFIR